MENRRADDPWKHLMDERVDLLYEKLEKNTLMTSDLLDAWEAVREGMRAISFLAKAMKWLSGFIVSVAAIWGAVTLFLKG